MIKIITLAILMVLTVVPMLAFKEVRNLNKEINIENWSIKPVTMSNSKSLKRNLSPKTVGIFFGIFAIIFVMFNLFNFI